MFVRALVLVLILTFGPVVTLPNGHAAHDGLPDVLWLRGDPDGGRSHNFTTYPPEASGTGTGLDLLSVGTYSDIPFAMARLPGEWSVGPGADLQLETWISGLDLVIAPVSVSTYADEPDQVVVQAELIEGGTERFAVGRASVQTDPIEPQEGPRRLIIPLGVERSVAYSAEDGPGPGFRLTLTVFGHSRPEHDLLVHVASSETPSRIHLPSFPVDAFRAWEDQEAEAAACHRAIQEGGTCAPDTEETGDDRREVPAPLPWFLGIAAMIAGYQTIRIGRRH